MSGLVAILIGIINGIAMWVGIYYLFDMSNWINIERVLWQWFVPILFGCTVSMGIYINKINRNSNKKV